MRLLVRSLSDLDDADETEPMLKDIARSVRVGHGALPASFVTTRKLPP
jgi:hypothetical protein